MNKRSIFMDIALSIAISAAVVMVIVLVTTPAPQPKYNNCTASHMPAAPQYKQVPDPRTGLVPKDSNIDAYVYPKGMIQTGTVLGDKGFKDFLAACGTSYTVSDQAVYIDQKSYNYVLQVAGLNANFRNGVHLSEAAASSLGLNPHAFTTSWTNRRVTTVYSLIPAK
jgi:hypothetical protein